MQDFDDERAKPAHHERDEDGLGGLRHLERWVDCPEDAEGHGEHHAERQHLLLDFLELEEQLLGEEAERQHERQVEDHRLQHVVRHRRHPLVGLQVGAQRQMQLLQVRRPVAALARFVRLLDGGVAAAAEDRRQLVGGARQLGHPVGVELRHVGGRRRQEVRAYLLGTREAIAQRVLAVGANGQHALIRQQLQRLVLLKVDGGGARHLVEELGGVGRGAARQTELLGSAVQPSVQNEEGVLRDGDDADHGGVVPRVDGVFDAVEERQRLREHPLVQLGGDLRLRLARVNNSLHTDEVVIVLEGIGLEARAEEAGEGDGGALVGHGDVARRDVA